ncbi:PD-(D/E)XK nuclease-like domain-containing protein [Brucella anthropi]|uniref:Putative exodeoxyribonuclease 8 PDDEXK-like domain-containing protein n=1 Tax=Brucella anthropi (strain ATCC 49188 / DSM 6882 / CCUG 24695 / JCM 21032 / LMG 3331 / NBRC 15819 / NCTC 12168 / Alc 37) TaxID=439375 RepID=A6WZ62_BRUA4|nr:PD-(D/E)XK nuclease-like domain-containing protein [Brucella anthropi]ABS14266.1 hypothetical protein Oant_1550 [Brucella anthropi ATCC 49188]NKC48152.1 hypothetical protein [Brucella anthropi ATCC 49188]QQC25797.1 PD-(D/E)XK nuclease-like domain-containing protein [Brucella anthropi]RRY08863.1 hypothetical protein EGJ58_13275 [Brucella anthropi]SUA65389.1 exonuclease VIII [Brucella anthropi]
MIYEHADGLYFGLEDAIYHADPALGSTNHKMLAVSPEGYWHGSNYNPARPSDKDTDARALGRGVHKAALEGLSEFRKNFVRRPENFERLTEKSRALLAPRGETILSGANYDRALLASAMIRAHPDLVNSLDGGAPEVSIFWTIEVDGKPVRCKGRFDFLKPRAIVDLKSISITQPHPFQVLCIRAIRRFRYLVQTGLYLEGRKLVRQFIREGRVYGDAPPELVERLGEEKEFAFVFIFWASDGPPLVWSTQISPGNPILADSYSIIEQARINFVNYRERFGTEALWLDYQPLAELTASDFEGAYGGNW